MMLNEMNYWSKANSGQLLPSETSLKILIQTDLSRDVASKVILFSYGCSIYYHLFMKYPNFTSPEELEAWKDLKVTFAPFIAKVNVRIHSPNYPFVTLPAGWKEELSKRFKPPTDNHGFDNMGDYITEEMDDVIQFTFKKRYSLERGSWAFEELLLLDHAYEWVRMEEKNETYPIEQVDALYMPLIIWMRHFFDRNRGIRQEYLAYASRGDQNSQD